MKTAKYLVSAALISFCFLGASRAVADPWLLSIDDSKSPVSWTWASTGTDTYWSSGGTPTQPSSETILLTGTLAANPGAFLDPVTATYRLLLTEPSSSSPSDYIVVSFTAHYDGNTDPNTFAQTGTQDVSVEFYSDPDLPKLLYPDRTVVEAPVWQYMSRAGGTDPDLWSATDFDQGIGTWPYASGSPTGLAFDVRFVSTPDGGTTLVLAGLGLLACLALNRKFAAA